MTGPRSHAPEVRSSTGPVYSSHFPVFGDAHHVDVVLVPVQVLQNGGGGHAGHFVLGGLAAEELKEEINEEKIVYGQVRAVTFVRSQVVPKVSRLLKSSPKTGTLEKLGSLLGDMYKDGDLDLRSVVTIALLNQLDDQDFETLKPHLGEELQKAVRFTRKLKGKKVKPEKKKKEKKVVARLDDKH